MSHPIVILGSGLAGYSVARELRKLDAKARLLIVSRDHGGFYSKPMLSNALASKKTADTLLMKDAEKMAHELDATLLAHTTVRSINASTRQIELEGGETLAYRDLVLALGADPIRSLLQGDGATDVLSVNDLDDYARFAEGLANARNVVILGAGLIGCEFANDLLSRGIAPTVIDPAARPLSRLLPEVAATRLREKIESAGACFHFGVTVDRIDRIGETLQLTLSDSRTISTDLVLSAIGLKPRTALAAGAGISVNRGVVTDQLLATQVPHVFALGDCAEVNGINLPYVMPIMQQARALAATLAGRPTPVVYPAMPVTVKTPACPTVVCPPPPNSVGTWTETLTDTGCDARFFSTDNKLLGFALLGTATTQRQTLAAQVPGLF